jgi:hypothetical protein
MAKAYDRVKQANNQSDNFIKTPYWTNEVEDAFEEWYKKQPAVDLARSVADYLDCEVAISFKQMGGSICCTLAHQPSKEAQLPYLLTGWSDHPEDALAVAGYKLDVMLGGVWQEPPARPAPRRR